MKKGYLFWGFGVLLFFVGSFIIFNRNDIVVEPPKEVMLTKDEASNLLVQLTRDVIKVYENPNALFDCTLEEIDGKKLYKVNNYLDVISSLFTKKGINELEKMKFNDGIFVQKNDNEVYFMSELPSDNRFIDSSISLDFIDIKMHEISCNVTFNNSLVDENGILRYYVISKQLKIVKVDGNWLVDSFLYSNK